MITIEDPARLEVLRHAFETVPEEMGAVLYRSCYTTVIKDLLDYSCATFDGKGRLIAQASHIPSHLGSMGSAIKKIVQTWHDKIFPGDVFLTNDPYGGGTHTSDVHIFIPVFVNELLIGFVGNIAHHGDWGGRVAGTISSENKSVFEEGVIYPGVKLYDQGTINSNVYEIIRSNIRQPLLGMGDLRAQIASANTGLRCFKDIINRYGDRIVKQTISDLIDYSNQRTRIEIKKLPEGIYYAEGYLDGDGINSAKPLKIKVNILIRDDEITVDFSGTDPQTESGINCPLSTTNSAAMYGIRSILDPNIPTNEGCFNPLKVLAPIGTVVNPKFPAAVSDRHLTSQRTADTVIRAFANVVPEKISSGCFVGSAWMSCYPINPKTGERQLLLENIVGGAGATSNHDGADAVDTHLASCALISAEVVEMNYPLRVKGYMLRPDSGGCGKYRGGRGMVAKFLNISDESIIFQCGIEQTNPDFAPWGLCGGMQGENGRFRIKKIEKKEPIVINSRGSFALNPGEELLMETGGGGGFGLPSERDPDLVKKDVLDGAVLVQSARNQYGVCLSPDLNIDMNKTKKNRNMSNQ